MQIDLAYLGAPHPLDERPLSTQRRMSDMLIHAPASVSTGLNAELMNCAPWSPSQIPVAELNEDVVQRALDSNYGYIIPLLLSNYPVPTPDTTVRTATR